MCVTSRAKLDNGASLAKRVDELLSQYAGQAPAAAAEPLRRLLSDLLVRLSELEAEIQAQRTTLKQLESYRDRYIDLYDFAPLGYVTLDDEGYIQEINLAGAWLLGSERAAMVGYPFLDFVSAADQGIFRNYLQQCCGQRREATCELGLVAKDGRRIAAHFHSVPLEADQDGEVFCKTAITDLTATKQARSDIQATYRELEAFTSSVCHDLRSPLQAIGGFSQLLAEEYAARLDGDALEYLAHISAGVSHMEELIDDLLELSRVSQSELRRSTVDLSALARTVADELRQSHPERCVTFAIQEDVTAVGDPHLLRVALENLLGNAWKYTSKHQTALIEFGVTTRDGEPAYFVRDDGAGFDMRSADKIFDAFQRLHSADEFQGTGIGLSTVQRIIHAHGGRLWAEAAIERGAVFFFTIPPV